MCVRARLHRVAHVGPPVPPCITGMGEDPRECAARAWNKEATELSFSSPNLASRFSPAHKRMWGVWCARRGSGNQEGQHRSMRCAGQPHSQDAKNITRSDLSTINFSKLGVQEKTLTGRAAAWL